jgi:hypothetical protein
MTRDRRAYKGPSQTRPRDFPPKADARPILLITGPTRRRLLLTGRRTFHIASENDIGDGRFSLLSDAFLRVGFRSIRRLCGRL